MCCSQCRALVTAVVLGSGAATLPIAELPAQKPTSPSEEQATRARVAEERLHNDWANLQRYRQANAALPALAPGEKRVVFMGNSITEGFAPYFATLFPGKPYVGRGIGGQTTPQMLVRFRQDVIALRPTVVVILAGTNDIAGNTGPSSIEMIEDNLASMAELAKANGIRVVLASVLPVFDYPWKPGLQPAQKIVALNGWLQSYAASSGAVYLDYHAAMADERQGMKAALSGDGVHPNEAGYRVMAPLTEQAIGQALGAARALEHAHGDAAAAPSATPASGFGEIHFATSATPAAHAAFERGVLYLHNFHYPQAAAAFREGQKLDPGDVMSYWGEAMTYTHPVWNDQDTPSAQAVLARLADTRAARLAKARTPRERAWLDAVETLYAPEGGSKARRDTAFARAMAQLHRSDPNDPDAASFYALALLGLNQAEREQKAYAQAYAIADSVFRAYPRHPGGAHYLIHAVDDPDHARLGLAAARAYSTIAPDAGHALHMTSHIFVALGMWDDVASANVRSLSTMRRPSGHVTQWLVYGFLQQGRFGDATRWMDSLTAYARATGAPANADAASHVALTIPEWLIDTHRWGALQARLTLDTTQLGLDELSTADFGFGLAALRRGERSLADARLRSMSARRRAATPTLGTRFASAVPVDQLDAARSIVRERTLGALMRAAGGDTTGAVAVLDSAAVQEALLPTAFGPPVMVYQPREAAGDLLLAARRWAKAREEFQLALARTPGRPAVLLGLARSARALGAQEESRRFYRQLAAIWHDADPDVPGLAEVRAAVSSATQ